MEWPRRLELAAPFEGRMPKVDMLDRENEVVVRAELPGIVKDDLEVTVTGHSVTIRAETKHEEKKEEEKYYRHEMSRGEYQRTLALPVTVDENKAKATFEDGVLELTLPKMEKARQRKVKVE
jgi:HSP20 family protein